MPRLRLLLVSCAAGCLCCRATSALPGRSSDDATPAASRYRAADPRAARCSPRTTGGTGHSPAPSHARSSQWLSHMSPTGGCTRTSARRTATARLRDPDHRGRQGVTARSRCTFDVRRARATGSRYPLGARHQDRGRPRLRRRPARDRRATGTCRLYETWATRGRRRPLARRLRRAWSLSATAAPRRLDLGGRGRPADPARAAALERGKPDRRPRDPLHHRRHQPAPRLAGPARRRLQDSLAYPPMGARFRLKSSYHADRVRRHARVVVRDEAATAWSSPTTGRRGTSRASRTRGWPDRSGRGTQAIPASAFVAVDTSSLRVGRNSAPPAKRPRFGRRPCRRGRVPFASPV